MADFYGPTRDREEEPSIGEYARRFPEWASGREVWLRWFQEGRWRQTGGEALDELISELRDKVPPHQPECPRIFVSHRQHDAAKALRIAQLANTAGFEFWLDILDPKLQWLAALASHPSAAYSCLIASTIEIALLNCTHVIAALSDQTRGTLWVPYEYGRVKERQIHSRRAAVWLHKDIARADVPEYTALGVRTTTELEISGWLANELSTWCRNSGKCCNGAGNTWFGGPTHPLIKD